ncbi:F0F1 ATP synthase subunit gamma [Tautonia rosea]|uniref:F0F1 ATP synthase subunit gamma n=1 Tax=Tautonia rosea TaxID=2728037 RepID=UPI00147453C9|nr:F0F1 ATP synthase subunit gamma [Tautonia rosea]
MQTIEGLKRKLATAEDLHSVVKTMKTLAVVNIRQYEEAERSLDYYSRAVEMGLQIVLRQGLRSPVVARKAPSRNLAAIVFGSDQGMCGQLNDEVVRHAISEMDDWGIDRAGRTLFAVGHRISGRLEDAGQPLGGMMSVPGSTSGITPAVQDLLLRIDRWRDDLQIDRVVLFFADHHSGATCRPRTERLLPVDEHWLQDLQSREWPTNQVPTYTMNWDRLVSSLVREYLYVSLYRAFVESLASENASRLASMQGAERNIEDRIVELTMHCQQRRQLAITEELLDVASGYEALTNEKRI